MDSGSFGCRQIGDMCVRSFAGRPTTIANVVGQTDLGAVIEKGRWVRADYIFKFYYGVQNGL